MKTLLITLLIILSTSVFSQTKRQTSISTTYDTTTTQVELNASCRHLFIANDGTSSSDTLWYTWASDTTNFFPIYKGETWSVDEAPYIQFIYIKSSNVEGIPVRILAW